MKKHAPEVAGYTTLPLQLPPNPAFPVPTTHYLYIRPHEPRIPDPDSARSLFLVNAPIDTTEVHLRHLFGTQLSAGRVSSVEFEDVPTKKPGVAAATESNLSHRPKKRKRVTADDLQSKLDDVAAPQTWNRQLHKSGAHVIVLFADKPSMEASLKAAVKAAKKGTTIVWGEGLADSKVPPLGIQRYVAHERMRYPERAVLLRTVNEFMTVFGEVSEARKREEAKKFAEPDDDGFVTVTHGPKLNSTARENEMKELVERQKKKEAGLEDFYRFQSREKRKERQNELLRKFGEDKKKLQEIKMRRGKIRVCLFTYLNYFCSLAMTFSSGIPVLLDALLTWILLSIARVICIAWLAWRLGCFMGHGPARPSYIQSKCFLIYLYRAHQDEHAGASVARRACRCLRCHQKPAINPIFSLF